MVDKDLGSYRPRRAYPAEPAEPEVPPATGPIGGPPSAGADAPFEPRSDPQLDPRFDDEARKPLYRDEVYRDEARAVDRDEAHAADQDEAHAPTIGGGSTAIPKPASGADEETRIRNAADTEVPRISEQTQILSRARARVRGGARPTDRPRRDEDSTTILPRTAAGARIRRSDDDTLDDEPPPVVQRSKLGLLIAAVAGIVVLGLAIGYTVLSLTRPSAAPGVPPAAPAAPGGPSSGSSGPPADPGSSALLTDASLLTPRSAAKIDSDRTWAVQLTQKGQSAESPQPACLGGEPVEGQPIPQQSMLRVLTSSGRNPPAVLQQADAYTSPEEAAQAYAVAAKTLGGCAMTATYIESAAAVTRLGDQSLGLTLRVSEGGGSEYRTVILTRTGRVVDAVDVAQPEAAVGVDRLAQAAADVVNAQCKPAGGACASKVQVKAAPPPVGGDAPGFLATADLPPVGTAPTSWVANKPATPDSDLIKGSGCETVDWAKQAAVTRAWRTYLLQDSPSRFGLDEVILTQKSPADAKRLVDKVREDWENCGKRQLTATVSTACQDLPRPVPGTLGSTAGPPPSCRRPTTATTTFRVGIAAAGPKVIFTFLNPQDKLDLGASAFADVTARARPATPRRPADPERGFTPEARGTQREVITWRISSAASLGVFPTWTPAASSASFLAAAVPDEPDTMAPACPMVLPSGAVNPAT